MIGTAKQFFFGLLLIALSGAVFADLGHFSFSEPGTGRKTDSYSVELNFTGNNVRQFTVPADCSSIISEVTFGMSSPNGTIDRGLWFKVINDCRYVQFMHQNEDLQGVQDFVSDYDFYNAHLADLPFESKCRDKLSLEECKSRPTAPDKLKISMLFPFLEIREHRGEPVEICRFDNGSFRGFLLLTNEGLRCSFDRRGNGLRLLSVDYGDFNADGFQDVLLRMMPLGRGISRMPILLPLTRFESGQPFTLPAGLSIDIINQ